MKIIQLLEGKPFMTEYGIVGYSTAVLVQEGQKIERIDARRCIACIWKLWTKIW
jgi:hypothetical protein